jgi:hypothetical protein
VTLVATSGNVQWVRAASSSPSESERLEDGGQLDNERRPYVSDPNLYVVGSSTPCVSSPRVGLVQTYQDMPGR